MLLLVEIILNAFRFSGQVMGVAINVVYDYRFLFI